MTLSSQCRLADSPEARREFLRGLPEAGFVPPEQFIIAPTDEVKALRADIDAFCERFWTLSPIERQTQWSALSAAAKIDSRSQLRLRRMEPAVLMPTVAGADFTGAPGMIVLALKELCTLAPPERAARRAAFLRDLKPPIIPWRRAAAMVSDQRADLAALDRPLIEQLLALGTGKSYARRATIPKSFQQIPAGMAWSHQFDIPGAGLDRQSPRSQPRRQVQNPAGLRTVIWIGVTMSLLSMGRACTNVSPRLDSPQINAPYKSQGEYERMRREKGLLPGQPFPDSKDRSLDKADSKFDELRRWFRDQKEVPKAAEPKAPDTSPIPPGPP
jgi:hypothetical protein